MSDESEGSNGFSRERLVKLSVLTFGFGIPLVIMEFFLVGRYPVLYVPFVLMIGGYLWGVRRIGGWK